MDNLNEEERPEAERRQELLRRCAAQLAEHFDTVQIFATKDNGDEGTIAHNHGAGNWFARYGQVKQWCIQVDERDRINVRREDD